MPRSVSTTHKVGDDKTEIVARVPDACRDEAAAVAFLEDLRWSGEPYCPHCGDFNVRKMEGKDGARNKRFLWRCGGCREQFTVRIGTVMEDSRIPFRFWCLAFYRACASKKGVSALQIKRETGLSYKSALFLMHRVRWAMTDSTGPKLKGEVQADETFVGGKLKGKSKYRLSNKTPVFALVESKDNGRLRAFPIERVDTKTLRGAIQDNATMVGPLVTDEWHAYRAIGKDFRLGHQTLNHFRREYSRDGYTTNTVEGFFALLKRGIMGTFHSVSKRHLHRYVTEFEFRWNLRRVDDGERTRQAIKGAEWKRLRYKN